MNFSISNIERPYFGLNLIEEHWDEMIVPPGRYDKNPLIIYFDGNTIVKEIVSTDDFYYENDTSIETEERTLLLPRTSKGKKSKLTQANLTNKYSGQGVYFRAGKHLIQIANYTTQTNYYSSWYEQIGVNDVKEFEQWKQKFIKESDANHLNRMQEFKQAERVHVKYKKGDIFAYKISRTEYGYGKILENIKILNKKGNIPQKSYLRQFMSGAVLLVCLYAYKSKEEVVDLSLLENCLRLPSQFISDNEIYFGEYSIIGNQDVHDHEMDYPISLFYSGPDYIRIDWGAIRIESNDESVNKAVYEMLDKLYNEYEESFYSGALSSYLKINYNALERVINEKDITVYYSNLPIDVQLDLRNPKFKNLKKKVFKLLGLDDRLGYVENLYRFIEKQS